VRTETTDVMGEESGIVVTRSREKGRGMLDNRYQNTVRARDGA
jgi:hypothetical protein